MKSKGPAFGARPCTRCDGVDCRVIEFVMVRPIIIPVEGGKELGSMVQFPVDNLQSFVDYLRQLALEKGVKIK